LIKFFYASSSFFFFDFSKIYISRFFFQIWRLLSPVQLAVRAYRQMNRR